MTSKSVKPMPGLGKAADQARRARFGKAALRGWRRSADVDAMMKRLAAQKSRIARCLRVVISKKADDADLTRCITGAPHMPNAQLSALTGLRFFAASAIVLHHLRGTFGLGTYTGLALSQAVSVFFVLSGFILAYAHPDLPTWKDRSRFWLARFARI